MRVKPHAHLQRAAPSRLRGFARLDPARLAGTAFAVGEVVWRTGRGVFGKSAKMEVALRYIDLAGRRIPLWGHYHQEGRGNPVATVGAVVAAGVAAGLLVTGRSAVIPAGHELEAVIVDTIPVVIPASGPAAVDESYRPSPIRATGRTQIVRRRPEPDER